MHKPLFWENPTAKGLVMFIHGFMGSPAQFAFLAEACHSHGYAVASLLLPGHGVRAKEFATATKESWLNHVYAEMERYTGLYDSVYLVGHSMGCLLALNAAHKYAGHTRGLFLIACPLRLRRFSPYVLQTRLKQALYPASHPMKATYMQVSGVPLSISLLWSSAKPARELQGLQYLATDILPRLRAPVTAVYSRADEMVDMASLGMLQAGLREAPFTQIILENSLHAYYPPPEQGIIKSALLRSL